MNLDVPIERYAMAAAAVVVMHITFTTWPDDLGKAGNELDLVAIAPWLCGVYLSCALFFVAVRTDFRKNFGPLTVGFFGLLIHNIMEFFR